MFTTDKVQVWTLWKWYGFFYAHRHWRIFIYFYNIVFSALTLNTKWYIVRYDENAFIVATRNKTQRLTTNGIRNKSETKKATVFDVFHSFRDANETKMFTRLMLMCGGLCVICATVSCELRSNTDCLFKWIGANPFSGIHSMCARYVFSPNERAFKKAASKREHTHNISMCSQQNKVEHCMNQ